MPLKCELVVEGPDNWAFTREVGPGECAVIGRHSSRDIALQNPRVSSKHARVYWQDGAFWVEDLGSSNATWLNGQKVEAPARLSDGDTIFIKPFTMAVRLRERPDDLVEIGSKTSENVFARLFGEELQHTQEMPALSEASEILRGRIASRERRVAAGESPTKSGEQKNAELRQALDALEVARRINRQLQYRVRMHRRIHFSKDETEALQGIMELAQKALKADAAFLMFINPRTKAREVKCKSKDFDDLARSSMESGARSPISLSLVERALAEKKPQLAPRQGAPAPLKPTDSVQANEIAAAVAAPLFENDLVVGCFYADRRGQEASLYVAADAEDALAYAQIFVDAAVHFVGRRMLAEEEERAAQQNPQAKKLDHWESSTSSAAGDIFEDDDEDNPFEMTGGGF
jgi:predicted component of type VI protein secretion system